MESQTVDAANPSHILFQNNATGLVDVRHDSSDVTMTVHQEGQDQTREVVITIGADGWFMGAFLQSDRPWLHARAQTGRTFSEFNVLDPTRAFGALKARGAGLRLVGPDSVRGVPTTQYRVSLPPGAFPRSSQIKPTKSSYEVWIDQGNLVRRIRITSTLPAEVLGSSPGPLETVTETFEFFDFGVPTDIQPPPVDQVEDEPAFKSQVP